MMDSGGPVQRFRGAEYRRLLAAARRYLERTGGDLAGTVSLKNPDDAERKAVIGLTGKHRAAGSAQIAVRLADLDESLREATGRGLAELLAALGPPLRDLPRDRERLAAGRDATIRSVEKSSLHALGWYQAWLAEIARDGTLTKLVNAGEEERVRQAARALEAVEARAARTGPVQLAELAAEVTGDTKALNHGTVLATLVLRALAMKTEVPRPATAEQRRELWDSCGIVVDDLASRALVLNLPSGRRDRRLGHLPARRPPVADERRRLRGRRARRRRLRGPIRTPAADAMGPGPRRDDAVHRTRRL
jgi:uncharacterized protein (TIGR02679 family)